MNANLMHALIDSIFNPITGFLQMGIDYLDRISLISSRGLYLGNFLGPVAFLGQKWTMLLTNLVAAAILLATVAVTVTVWRGYLQAKSGLKWW